MKLRAALLAMVLAVGCADGPETGAPPNVARPVGFVDAATVVAGLVVDMRYHGSENFVGRRIDGYEASVCLLTKEAANALAKAQENLARYRMGLKVYDCYRPSRAVADFARWARDPADQKRKADYYPNVDKSRLFELGYIAERSRHSRGSTVDVTVMRWDIGEEVDMGSSYDLFDTRSWPSDQTVSASQQAARKMLATVMQEHGFRPLKEEWWHFTLNNEPYPDTYFDFPVK